jgi:putative ABC transport system substrate-binding protein
VRRRDFIKVIAGSAIPWPLAARAQQPAMPVIGFMSARSLKDTVQVLGAFHKGLGEVGFVSGQNVNVEYRWADGQYERLPAMAAELVRRPVDVMVAQAPPAALAAKVATTSIPIVFVVGVDPIAAGLVGSFNKPGGNATGMTLITGPLAQKRLELLREIAPKVNLVMLANPISPDAAPEIRDVQASVQATGFQLRMLNATTPSELNAAFASLSGQRPDVLLVGSDPFFVVRREEIIALAARLGVPAIYPFREFADSGGLISYGTNIPDAYRQAGIYVGRILKGAQPAELPVVQPTKFELVINLKTAKTLGINIPPILHARSDEVIE